MPEGGLYITRTGNVKQEKAKRQIDLAKLSVTALNSPWMVVNELDRAPAMSRGLEAGGANHALAILLHE